MKILIVCRYKENHEHHILPFIYEQGMALQAEGCVVKFFIIEGNGMTAYFKERRRLVSQIEEFRPDVIHAHFGLSGVTATLQDKVPVITTFHNGEVLSKGVNLLCSLFSLKAKYVVYVAQHIYDKCFLKRRDRHCILPCGVNLDDYPLIDKEQARSELGFEPGKKYILFGGAFSNLRKNYPLLKEALDILGRKDIEVLEMSGLTRPQVAKLMCACDLFALPSKSEGSPQALKEAMACNCPVIATDIADVKHLLGDLPGHFLCSFDAQKLAGELDEALKFEGRTEGRKRIVELGLTNELVARKLIGIYESII